MDKRLRDLSPEQMVEILEKRMEDYADAFEAEGNEKSRHDALSAGLYDTFREVDKKSIEDAKRALWSIEDYRESDKWVRQATADALRAKMAVERARIAIDLYRSEQVSLRKV